MATMPAIKCEKPSSEGLDLVGYLFGYPIAHSMSPLMHGIIFKELGMKARQFLYASTQIDDFMALTKDPKFFGSSVTMPHKVAIMPYLDGFTDEGREVGAINTVFFREEGSERLLIGTNTDVIGIREAFYQNIPNPAETFEGRAGLVIGGGGAARSAVYALKRFMKCKEVYLINRDHAEVDAVVSWCTEHGYGDGLVYVATAEQAEKLDSVGAIVACVPDFPPVTETEKAARAAFEVFLAKPHKGAILEMCYHPRPWTAIAHLSQKAGWTVVLGTEAMLYQGFAQSTLWTGKSLNELPIEKCKQAVAEQLAKSHK